MAIGAIMSSVFPSGLKVVPTSSFRATSCSLLQIDKVTNKTVLQLDVYGLATKRTERKTNRRNATSGCSRSSDISIYAMWTMGVTYVKHTQHSLIGAFLALRSRRDSKHKLTFMKLALLVPQRHRDVM